MNGTEIARFPITPSQWNSVSVTNNIIANNVAGWDGAGVSLQDALNVDIINNTIISNDTTASAGVLFNTLGAPIASAPGSNCIQTGGTTRSCPQPAGLVTMQNTTLLTASLPATVLCPVGHGTGGTGVGGLLNGNCRKYSMPRLYNDLIWQNRSFYIGVGSLGTGTQNQQNVVALYNAFTSTQAISQPQADATTANGNGVLTTGGTGACTSPASYWDIGARGDTGPTDHSSGVTLNPTYSVLTDATDYPGNNNQGSNPAVLRQYCNGSRTPPEFASMGYQVPPGISDATVPNPIFNLTPAATVDEGNNWINMSWGPLAMTHPVTGATLGNYALATGSPAIDYIPLLSAAALLAPNTDFFGNPRPSPGTRVDVGAIEFQPPKVTILSVTPTSLAFGSVVTGTTSAAQTLTLTNSGGLGATGITVVVTAPFSRSGGTCGTTLAAGATCTINVVFSPTALVTSNGTATITANVAVTYSPVALSGTGATPIRTATVTPNPLAFGNWATGTTSSTLNLTVTNTGNVALTGGTFTFGGGTPQPFTRVTSGTFPAGAPNCGATLTIAASCTVKVRFAPTTAVAFSRTMTVTYTGATVSNSPVTLTGTGLAARATVSITPNPLTITLPTGTLSGTGIVTLTNTAAAGGAQFAVTNIAVAGGTILTYTWNAVIGGDTCTGATLAPGASCTVNVRFSNIGSPRGTGASRAGTITFTDGGAGSSQVGALSGIAN